jgi:hypothetical protein
MILVGNENKAFEHDCDECVFLGHKQGERPCDLYLCKAGETCLIARYSDEPSDNTSRSVEMMERFNIQGDKDDLGRAYQLASVLGYID